MQRLHVDNRLRRFAAAETKNISRSAFELRFPARDLVWMDVELLRKLHNRSIAFNRRKGHFRFESRCVVPARSSLHDLS